MKPRRRAVVLAVAIACWLAAGCGSAVNEEGFDKGSSGPVTRPEGMPNFKSQGEYEMWRTEQARKKKSEPAGKDRPQSGSKSARR